MDIIYFLTNKLLHLNVSLRKESSLSTGVLYGKYGEKTSDTWLSIKQTSNSSGQNSARPAQDSPEKHKCVSYLSQHKPNSLYWIM